MNASKRAQRLSQAIYTSISLAAALAFAVATTAIHGPDNVMRFGGAAWVFLLSMIITMPTITPWVKKRGGSREA